MTAPRLGINLDILRETLKNMAPKKFRKRVREFLKQGRSARNGIEARLWQRRIGGDDIVRALRTIDIAAGDTLLVHSSLSRLGKVNGGAETVLTALQKAVGTTGTIGAPTFWGNTSIYVAGSRRFDVKATPSILGAVTEQIRRHPDAERSLHPTHSAAFIGPNAHYLTKDHHKDSTPVGMNSPYFRLISVGGKIILLGVTPEYMTNFHTIEDVVQNFPEQVYLTRKLDFEVVNEDGNTIHIETYCHCPAAGDKRQCMKMVPYLERYGVIKRARLGHAEVIVVDARGLHEALLDLFSKGVTMYNPKPT